MTDWLTRIFPFVGALRLYNQLVSRTPSPLLVIAPGSMYRLRQINGTATRWYYCVLEIEQGSIILYPRTRGTQQQFLFAIHALRWFGRPKKYEMGSNDIWLHLEQDDLWTLLEIRLHHAEMRRFVRTLKTITHETMVKAYRRQRPYIHYGAVEAYPATQDIYGAWKLDEGVSLYIMPLYLVILRGSRVLRAVPLSDVQEITALRRLDEPTDDGLVRFRVAEESMAFAIEHHQEFADRLAEAARRSLEEPPIQKQKAHEDKE